MTRSRRSVLGLCGLAAAALLMPGVRDATAADRPLTVFAAASLKESLDEIAAEWTRRSGQKVVLSFAASSALARQIDQGAPADVFISADMEWMDDLQARQRIDPRSRFDLVSNRLVLIAPAASPLRTVDLAEPGRVLQALGRGRLAVAETGSVPAGRYARQSLTALGLWDALSSRLAQGDNVRAAMAFVARGEAPLGVVYATDAKAEPKVRVVARFAAGSHDRIVYPAARVATADADDVAGFLAFLRGPRARAVFRDAGFVVP